MSEALTPAERQRFERFVLVHLDSAYNLARYLVRDTDEAEDAVQEAFVRALRHFRGFRGGDGRAWLLAITRNACWSELQKRRSRLAATEFDETLHSPEPERSEPEADLARSLAGESLRRAMDGLPFVFRESIVLRELEGMSYREIAEVTGVPAGTVMSRLARARAHLTRILTADEGKR